MKKSWLQHYRNTYYELLSPEVSGAKRLLVEGIYKRAIGFDIMFRLLLNQETYKPDQFELVDHKNERYIFFCQNSVSVFDGSKIMYQFLECYVVGSLKRQDLNQSLIIVEMFLHL